jgi:beta-N-acetylhexosaminidase
MTIRDNSISRRSALRAGAAVLGGLGIGALVPDVSAQAKSPGSRPAEKLSTIQQAGQRVIYSYPGATPPGALLDLIRAGEVGGIIFFGENITSLVQIAGVVAQLKQAHAQGPVAAPLLLMTDQEGGKVRRLPGEPTLSEKQVGAAADPVAAATAAGTGAGQNLAGVGMNLNLAPVLDVFRVPGNFDDQFQRSYSTDPALCGELGAAFVTAQQQLDIAATAKHFPGLGAAPKTANTDLTTVTLDLTTQELREVDELPYVAAIAAGVQLVMTSWAVYPALDAARPAGLSATIIQDELRRRLGFRGVTITDALEAGSLAAFGSSADRGVLAAEAGMDLLLCSARDVSQGQTTTAALAAALDSHRLNPGHAKQALRRVLDLRAGLG